MVMLSILLSVFIFVFFFFQAEDGIRGFHVTGVQTCALPISSCSVSADGKRLVGTTEDQDWEIWKAPLGSDPKSNGEAAVRLLDHAWEPMWTQVPQAGMLLLNSPATGIRNLWITPLVGAVSPRQITFLPSANVSHAALSPDGARVAYVSVESGNGQIWVANTDGSGARRLTHNTATNFWPFWSPDGQWVAF